MFILRVATHQFVYSVAVDSKIAVSGETKDQFQIKPCLGMEKKSHLCSGQDLKTWFIQEQPKSLFYNELKWLVLMWSIMKLSKDTFYISVTERHRRKRLWI